MSSPREFHLTNADTIRGKTAEVRKMLFTKTSRIKSTARLLSFATVFVAAFGCETEFAEAQSVERFDGNLVDLLPSLYGGDGVKLASGTPFNHAAHFTGSSLSTLAKLVEDIETAQGPGISANSGLSFVFDPVLDDFVSSPDTISGSAYVVNPNTIGAGRLNLGWAYSHARYRELNGRSLGNLQVDLKHSDVDNSGGSDTPCIGGPPGQCYAFEKDVVRLNIQLDLLIETSLLFGSYGITDDWDIGIVIPVHRTRMQAVSIAEVVENPTKRFFAGTLHRFGADSDSPFSGLRGSKTGLGDIQLNSKYFLGKYADAEFAIAGSLRLPTGDEKNFQGVRGIGGNATFVAGKNFDFGGSALNSHANVSYAVNANARKQHFLRYAVGGTYLPETDSGKLLSGFGVSLDFLGEHAVVHRRDSRNDSFNLSLGLVWNGPNDVMLFYNALVPLDDNGIRPDVIHFLGFQIKF